MPDVAGISFEKIWIPDRVQNNRAKVIYSGKPGIVKKKAS
jgi:hypothetical protein